MVPDRRGVAALTIVALGLSLVGCTSASVGQPTSVQVTGSQPVTSAPSTTTSAKRSDRPREIKMDGVKPCELLTEQQRQTFAIDRPFSEAKDRSLQSPVCDFLSEKEKIGLALYPVTSRGVDAWAPGKLQGESREIRVSGFMAYEVWTSQEAGNQFCTVNVDVADGQVLSSHYSEQGRYQAPLGRTEICKRAALGAEAALTTLMGSR